MELRTIAFLLFVCFVGDIVTALKEGDPHTCVKTRLERERIYTKPKLSNGKCPEEFIPCTKTNTRFSKATEKCCKISPARNVTTVECCIGFRYERKLGACVFKCKNGLFLDSKTGNCSSKCSFECINSTCTDRNECTCFDGYKKKNDYSCIPDCAPDCVNSDCTGPNQCSCFEGYEHINASYCSPVCDNCANGDCIAPNVCQCHKGYVKENGVCTPICDNPCNNGYCSEPNVCECNFGFELDPKNKFNCFPICDPECVNASCVSPNMCSCYDGFEYGRNNWTCKPKCNECNNGVCVAPNKCECNPGFEKVRNKIGETCSPVCVPGCKNGNCVGPNMCSCKDGYEKDQKNISICYKRCKGPCENGICTVGGNCVCNPDYELHNETCTPIMKVDCSNCVGNCSDPHNCSCQDGGQCTMPEARNIEQTGMAGWETTWILYLAVVVLLVVLVIGVMLRIWKKRSREEAKAVECDILYGSVAYPLPAQLVTNGVLEETAQPLNHEEIQMKQTSEQQESNAV